MQAPMHGGWIAEAFSLLVSDAVKGHAGHTLRQGIESETYGKVCAESQASQELGVLSVSKACLPQVPGVPPTRRGPGDASTVR